MTTFAILFPTFLMLGLGMLVRRKQIMTPEQISGVNALVFDIMFPVMVFNALFTSGIPEGTLGLSAVVLILRILAMLLGWILGKATRMEQGFLLPYLYPSTDGGSVCYPLYATIVGASFIGNIIMLDLTSMIVAFLIIPVMLAVRQSNGASGKELWKNIISNRVVQVMIASLILNALGVYRWLQSSSLLEVYTGAVDMITGPIVALILFGIGYNFQLEKDGLNDLLLALAGRALVMGVGTVAVLQLFPAMSAVYEMRIAFLLYFVCSPALMLSGMLSPVCRNQKDKGFVSAFLSLSVIVSLVWYSIVAIFIA